MVRLFGPLKSQTARGHFAYPYPIDLYGVRSNFHPYGWVYEMRRTWHGMQPTARKFVYPPNPKTFDQQVRRIVFAYAVGKWQGLTPEQKDIYNKLRYPPYTSGYNKFIRYYMRFVAAGGDMTLLDKVKIWDGVEIALVTPEGLLEVKTHSSDECFIADYVGAQAAQVIITPAAGKKVVVRSVYISTENIATDVELKWGTSGNHIFKLYTSKKQSHTGNAVCAEGAVDETVKLTCGAGTFVSIAYDEV